MNCDSGRRGHVGCDRDIPVGLGGSGVGIGAASGALGGAGIGAMTSSNAQQSIRIQYNNAFAQCMFTRGNAIPGFSR